MASNRTRRFKYLIGSISALMVCSCGLHRDPLPTESNVGVVYEQLSEAMKTEPKNGRLYVHRAKCELVRRHYVEALADADRAVALGRNDADVHQTRGRALAGLQRSEDALSAFASAQKRAPRDPFLYEQRAVILQRQNRHRDAIDECTRGLALTPAEADPSLLTVRAMSYEQLNDSEKAVEDCNHALGLTPDIPAALLVRARCNTLAGKFTEARQDAEAAAKKGTERQKRDALMAKADSYYVQRSWSNAYEEYRNVRLACEKVLSAKAKPADYSQYAAEWKEKRRRAVLQAAKCLDKMGRSKDAAATRAESEFKDDVPSAPTGPS